MALFSNIFGTSTFDLVTVWLQNTHQNHRPQKRISVNPPGSLDNYSSNDLMIESLSHIFFSSRNDLYLTIEQGYFERSGKARNVEVSAVIVGRNGQVIEDKIHFAAGLPPATRVGFPVIFHSNSPIWMETLRLEIPIDKFEGAHIRLEYRHCSSKNSFAMDHARLLGY